MWHIESILLAIWGSQVSVVFAVAVMLLLLCWLKYLDDVEWWLPTEKDSHTLPSSFLAIITLDDGVSLFNTEVDTAPGDEVGESHHHCSADTRKVSEMDWSVIPEDYPDLPNVDYDDFGSTPNIITDEDMRKGAFAMEDKLELMVAYFGGRADEHMFTKVDTAPGDEVGESHHHCSADTRKVSEMDWSVIPEDYPDLPNVDYDDFGSTPNIITDEDMRKGAFAMEDKLELMVAYFGGRAEEHTLPMSESDSDSDEISSLRFGTVFEFENTSPLYMCVP